MHFFKIIKVETIYYPKVYWLLKPRHLRVHLHINTWATCRVEVEFSSLAAFVPDDSQPGKEKNRHETKGTPAFETLCFSAASKDFSERKTSWKRGAAEIFFFPLLLNCFESVAPGLWFPLPLLLPRSSSSSVKSFRCKKVNLLLSLFIFFFF